MIRAQEMEIALRRGEQAENDRAKRARTRAARLAAREERRGSREQGSEKHKLATCFHSSGVRSIFRAHAFGACCLELFRPPSSSRVMCPETVMRSSGVLSPIVYSSASGYSMYFGPFSPFSYPSSGRMVLFGFLWGRDSREVGWPYRFNDSSYCGRRTQLLQAARKTPDMGQRWQI